MNTDYEYFYNGGRVKVLDVSPGGGSYDTCLIFIDGYLCGQAGPYMPGPENPDEVVSVMWFGDHNDMLSAPSATGLAHLGECIEDDLDPDYRPQDHMGDLPAPSQ